jgi:hypothetical protein
LFESWLGLLIGSERANAPARYSRERAREKSKQNQLDGEFTHYRSVTTTARKAREVLPAGNAGRPCNAGILAGMDAGVTERMRSSKNRRYIPAQP